MLNYVFNSFSLLLICLFCFVQVGEVRGRVTLLQLVNSFASSPLLHLHMSALVEGTANLFGLDLIFFLRKHLLSRPH